MLFRSTVIARIGALCLAVAPFAAFSAEPDAAKPSVAPAAEKATSDHKAGHSGESKVKRARTLEDAKKYHRARLEKLEKMTPEEWEALQRKRAEAREKWEKMTPEERAAAKKKRAELREKWEKMTPEEREKLIKKHGTKEEGEGAPVKP